MINRIVGSSDEIAAVNRTVAQVAACDIDVLLDGEEGTGRRHIARRLHQMSARAGGPLITCDLAALRPGEHEPSLFGARDQPGVLVAAHHGTLVLIEPGALRPPLQRALLQTLDRGRLVERRRSITVDVRVIAVTRRNLEHLVALGELDHDLFRRLSVVTISVPPVRARSFDVFELASHFARESGQDPPPRITAAASRALLGYKWPGNVRELKAVIDAACAHRPEMIDLAQLPEQVISGRETSDLGKPVPRGLPTLDTVERRYVREVLDAVDGNKSRASRVLGVDRRTLYRILGKIAADSEAGRSAD